MHPVIAPLILWNGITQQKSNETLQALQRPRVLMVNRSSPSMPNMLITPVATASRSHLMRSESKEHLAPRNSVIALRCDAEALPELQLNFLFDELLGFKDDKALSQATQQSILAEYRRPFAPERRQVGNVSYWSCNVKLYSRTLDKYVVLNHDGNFILADSGISIRTLTVPSSMLQERWDCQSLPWLAQFLGIGPHHSIDVGASDGECALGLMALDHHVSLVDVFYKDVLRSWVEMSLDLNGWRDRARFVNGVTAGTADVADLPTLDEIVRNNEDKALGIVKLDVDRGVPMELEVLQYANMTLQRTAILQLENDGWLQKGENYENDLLAILCANGMQPYAIRPDLVEHGVSKSHFLYYYNAGDHPLCLHLAEKRYATKRHEGEQNSWGPFDASLNRQMINFLLEPLCVCGTTLTWNEMWTRALCTYQIAAVQTRSESFATLRSKFGACPDFPIL